MARGTAVLTIVAALAWPASALATDRFVDDSGIDTGPCTSSGSPCHTMDYAIGQGASDGDTIRLGPGNYAEAISTNVTLDFEGAASVPAGAAFDPSVHTRVVSPADGLPGFSLEKGGTLRHLSVNGRSVPAFQNTSSAIEVLSLAGAPFRELTIDDVTAEGGVDTDTGAGEDFSQPALFVPDPLANDLKLTAEDSVFSAAEGAGGVVQVDSGDVELTLRRVAVDVPPDGFRGIEINGAADTLLQQVQVDGGGVYAFATGLTIDRSRIFNPEDSALQVYADDMHNGTDPVTATITDSLLVDGAAGGSTFEPSARGTTSLHVDVFNSTLIAPNGAQAMELSSFDSGQATVNAVNSNFRANGSAADLLVGRFGTGVAEFTASNSSWTTGPTTGGGTAPSPGSGTNIAGDPQLAGDFSLLPGSPLVDRGDPTGVTAGQLDLVGSPRILDGNGDCTALPDIGAFELTGHEGQCGAPAAGPGGPAGPGALDTKGSLVQLFRGTLRLDSRRRVPVPVECDRAEPDPCEGLLVLKTRLPANVAAKRKKRPARTVKLGQARFKIAPGKRVKVLVKLSRRNRARLRRLKRMRVTAKVTARDPAGNASSARATFTLKPRAVRKRKRR